VRGSADDHVRRAPSNVAQRWGEFSAAVAGRLAGANAPAVTLPLWLGRPHWRASWKKSLSTWPAGGSCFGCASAAFGGLPPRLRRRRDIVGRLR
jgi:hypothetical protein